MSTINEDDKFLVHRNGVDYQTSAENLMSTIQDTDKMIVDRGGQNFTVSCEDVKDQLGGSGATIEEPVAVFTPVDQAGITTTSTELEFDSVTFTSANGDPLSTAFLGTGTLDRRTWFIAESEDGVTYGSFNEYADDSVNASQDGGTEWQAPEGTIRAGKYYRVSVRYEAGSTTSQSAVNEFKTVDPVSITPSLRFVRSRQTELRRSLGNIQSNDYPITISVWVKTIVSNPAETWYLYNMRPGNTIYNDWGFGQWSGSIRFPDRVTTMYGQLQQPFDQPIVNGQWSPSGGLVNSTEWFHIYQRIWFADMGNPSVRNYYIRTFWNGVDSGTSSTADDWNLDGAIRNQTSFFGTTDWIFGKGYSGDYVDNGYVSQFCLMTRDGPNNVFEGNSGMDPTRFGFFDEDNVWTPKLPEESKNSMPSGIGPQSCFLSFDPTQPNGIGHDSSGRGNHFTALNFIAEDSQQPAPRSGMGKLYDERTGTTIMRYEMLAKYGTDSAINELGIYELTEQPTFIVDDYVKVRIGQIDKYRPVRTFENRLLAVQESLNELIPPVAVEGYYPLYTTEIASNAVGDGTSHSYTFNDTKYYMPNGVTNYYGDYPS